MRHFVEEILAEDRHLYEKDGQTIVLEKGRDARVAIDRSAMRVVLANLLENAARYSPQGFQNPHPAAPGSEQLPPRCYRQRDGIRGKDLKNVFKMFWRGSEEHGGRACAEPAWASISCGTS